MTAVWPVFSGVGCAESTASPPGALPAASIPRLPPLRRISDVPSCRRVACSRGCPKPAKPSCSTSSTHGRPGALLAVLVAVSSRHATAIISLASGKAACAFAVGACGHRRWPQAPSGPRAQRLLGRASSEQRLLGPASSQQRPRTFLARHAHLWVGLAAAHRTGAAQLRCWRDAPAAAAALGSTSGKASGEAFGRAPGDVQKIKKLDQGNTWLYQWFGGKAFPP